MSLNSSVIKDGIKPETVILEEAILSDSGLNLTEKEYDELGDEVPDQLLGCPVQV